MDPIVRTALDLIARHPFWAITLNALIVFLIEGKL